MVGKSLPRNHGRVSRSKGHIRMKRQYAMLREKYFVIVMNDESPKGYRVKVAPVRIREDGMIIRVSHSQWVDANQLQKLTPEVVDIMVSAHGS